MQSKEKIFPNLVNALVQTLSSIFIEGKYADKAIEKTLFLNKKWGARDRSFVAENTYEIVRYFRLLQFVYGSEELNEQAFRNLFAINQYRKGLLSPDLQKYTALSQKEIEAKLLEAKKNPVIAESFPDWMDQLARTELGKQWESEMQALNTQADVILRTNTLKISQGKLIRELEAENVLTKTLNDQALSLVKRQNIFGTKCFREGFFEVQDASSQLVAPFLLVEPGMRVIDACAGAGGKTLHLAALMKNKGTLIALDTEEWKLQNLKKRAIRASTSIIETRWIENSKTIKRLENSADRLLLDVPCSGLGVLRRNPDAKWKLQPTFIDKIKATQASILQQYATMLKPGGLMVYSTCSILPSENRGQVDAFLKNNTQFTLLKDQSILPSQGYDGFYMALLKKQ